MRLNKSQIDSIIKEYKDNLIPMIQLAQQYGITRQGIWKALNKYGIDTTKRSVEVPCKQCGKVILKKKCQIRNRYRNFCSRTCYFAYFSLNTLISRQGQRIGRKVMNSFFKLKSKYVVHHEDGNEMNNNINNLRVFASNGEHISYHRGGNSKPIWQM